MTAKALLDRDRVRELFDLRSSFADHFGGGHRGDPYPAWHRLRETGPVHPGVVHELTGVETPMFFHGLPESDRAHFSAFSFDAVDAAYRDAATFSSAAVEVDLVHGPPSILNSMLSMGGREHRRYRGLVQPSFVPAKAQWWIRNWIGETVDLVVDGFVDDGRAELNVDFCAAIPVLTITGSFGLSVEQALDVRASLASDPLRVIEMLKPVVASRRDEPRDDLISVLVEAELQDEDGTTHRLSDAEIHSFALLLLSAGSGTTWKQMGITLALLLDRPDVLARVRDDRELLRAAIEESVRYAPTDPMFSRWVTSDVEFFGQHIPAGSVLHLCLGAANRDPARWDRPDDYDVDRTMKPTVGFGGGPHICLGMHVARAEMFTGISALLDRLPNLRLDPDREPPQLIGMYERGATAIPVLWG